MKIVGFVYLLRCSDGHYYVGSHQGEEVAKRVAEHNLGVYKDAYTFRRRPVELVWSEYFYRYDEITAAERQIKGWSRSKKEALINGDSALLKKLASRSKRNPSS